MPFWRPDMTAENHANNAREMAEQIKRDARDLRARARALLEQADRLDPPEKQDV